MTVERLLRIDVEAELRKLTGHRFKTPGEHAVELVRFAARHGPGTVEVQVRQSMRNLLDDGKTYSQRGNTRNGEGQPAGRVTCASRLIVVAALLLENSEQKFRL